MNTDKNLICLSSSKNFKETNDCVVRAISIATGIDYATIHKLCEKRGRKPRKGFHPTSAFLLGRKKKSCIYKGMRISYRQVGKHKPTIPTFIKKNPVGRFVCIKHSHAFAVIDGKVYSQELDNSRIKYYLKISNNDSTSGQQEVDDTNTVCSEKESIKAGSEQLDNPQEDNQHLYQGVGLAAD